MRSVFGAPAAALDGATTAVCRPTHAVLASATANAAHAPMPTGGRDTPARYPVRGCRGTRYHPMRSKNQSKPISPAAIANETRTLETKYVYAIMTTPTAI